jgi:excisionase family DNA binding protein
VSNNNLSVLQVSERLGVDRETVRAWIHAGEFPNAYKTRPSAKTSPFVIPEADVIAFEERRHGQFSSLQNQESSK